MNFTTQKAAMKAWVEAQTGLPAVWRHEHRSWVGKTRALLDLHSTGGLGVDQLVYERDSSLPAGADLLYTIVGSRQMRLSILVEGRDQTPGGDAQVYLERLRTSLRKPDVLSAFRDAKLSFASAETVVNLDMVVQGRMESRASLDVNLNALETEKEDVSSAGSYVDKVEISADFGDGAGWTDEEFGNT